MSDAVRTAAISAVVAVLVSLVTSAYNKAMKDSENQLKYTELAIAQLSADPKPGTEAIRAWAMDIIDSQSPVKLPADAREQLKKNAIAPGATLTSHGSGFSSGAAASSVAAPIRQ